MGGQTHIPSEPQRPLLRNGVDPNLPGLALDPRLAQRDRRDPDLPPGSPTGPAWLQGKDSKKGLGQESCSGTQGAPTNVPLGDLQAVAQRHSPQRPVVSWLDSPPRGAGM